MRSESADVHTVFPPTIVRTARPFSFQPSKGVLREVDSNFLALTFHSRSGPISVMSAGAPNDSVPLSKPNNRAGTGSF